MNIPTNLKYTKDHEWVKVDGDVATIGITDFAQRELGDIVFVEIETVGETLAQEAVFGTVEAVKTVSDLFMPISGEVLELNTSIESNPEIERTARPIKKSQLLECGATIMRYFFSAGISPSICQPAIL